MRDMTASGRVERAEEVVRQQRASLPHPAGWAKHPVALADYMTLWHQLVRLQAVVMGEE